MRIEVKKGIDSLLLRQLGHQLNRYVDDKLGRMVTSAMPHASYHTGEE